MSNETSARKTKGRVLIVAGSDSGGGAGIQADIKAITALGGFAMTAVTALTAQNTKGVFGIQPVPAPFIRQQMELVIDDIGVDAVKVGMLHSAEVIDTVYAVLQERIPDVPLVVDPVMVAKGGQPLLEEDAMGSMRAWMVLNATVLTPNIPEAEMLTGMSIGDRDTMEHAAQMLLSLGPKAVLLKGGHMLGEDVIDLLATEDGTDMYSDPRINTPHTHGTGCTLASALACSIAQGMELKMAVRRARAYVRTAIESAPRFGAGHGPLNHAHTVRGDA